jgi:RNA polymerase sigma-70 factor (ECF subfamily)
MMEQPARVISEADAGTAEDMKLAAEVLRKDRKATAEFVSRYADSIYSYVRKRIMPRPEPVEDIVQEVFLAALQSLEAYRGEARLRHWLLGIARHKVEDYYRRRLREAEWPDLDDELAQEQSVVPQYEDEMDRATARERTNRVLSVLPETYALVLMWRYFEGRTTREIAQSTGKTEKAVERLLARAREQFKSRWDDAKTSDD